MERTRRDIRFPFERGEKMGKQIIGWTELQSKRERERDKTGDNRQTSLGAP